MEDGSWKILRSGAPGNYYYQAGGAEKNEPMLFLSYNDAAQYCAWKNNNDAHSFSLQSSSSGLCIDEELHVSDVSFAIAAAEQSSGAGAGWLSESDEQLLFVLMIFCGGVAGEFAGAERIDVHGNIGSRTELPVNHAIADRPDTPNLSASSSLCVELADQADHEAATQFVDFLKWFSEGLTRNDMKFLKILDQNSFVGESGSEAFWGVPRGTNLVERPLILNEKQESLFIPADENGKTEQQIVPQIWLAANNGASLTKDENKSARELVQKSFAVGCRNIITENINDLIKSITAPEKIYTPITIGDISKLFCNIENENGDLSQILDATSNSPKQFSETFSRLSESIKHELSEHPAAKANSSEDQELERSHVETACIDLADSEKYLLQALGSSAVAVAKSAAVPATIGLGVASAAAAGGAIGTAIGTHCGIAALTGLGAFSGTVPVIISYSDRYVNEEQRELLIRIGSITQMGLINAIWCLASLPSHLMLGIAFGAVFDVSHFFGSQVARFAINYFNPTSSFQDAERSFRAWSNSGKAAAENLQTLRETHNKDCEALTLLSELLEKLSLPHSVNESSDAESSSSSSSSSRSSSSHGFTPGAIAEIKNILTRAIILRMNERAVLIDRLEKAINQRLQETMLLRDAIHARGSGAW